MKASSLTWYALSWPREVSPDQLRDLSQLLASSGATPIVIEALGSAGAIQHRLGLPTRRVRALTRQLRAAIPALGLARLEERPNVEPNGAIEVRQTSVERLLRVDQNEAVSRALLTCLESVRGSEVVIIQWQLLGVLRAERVATSQEQAAPLPMSVRDVLLGRRERLDGETRQALRAKRSMPVYRAVGRVAVRAASADRTGAVLREVMAALRLADAPGAHLVAKRCPTTRLDRPGRGWLAPLRINTLELVLLAAWPIGSTADIPVRRSGARHLQPSRVLPRRGRVVGLASLSGRDRPIALGARDALRHLHVIGPTGTGKSTLLLNLITQDIAAGRGVVVLEPKGDLIGEVLQRIPRERLDDVVLLDPSDDVAPVGFNPLAADGRPSELVADELLGMFRRLYESSWGPRTNDILAASLLTLARTPGMTLCALPALLSDAGFRHRVVARLDDPIGLEPFWLAFENWSRAERQAAIAPSLNRIRPFLLRPQIRAVLGQPAPRFQLTQLFTERKIVLVNLAKGALGAESATLLGSLFLTQLWAAALRRSRVSPSRRRPTFVYIDEVQDYLHLPTDLWDALVQARGLGVGFILAHQHLAQLDPATRAALIANAQSRICFQLTADDARVLANGQLEPDDFRDLGAFEIYAQLVADDSVQQWCSARTSPPPGTSIDPGEVRQRSRELYGADRRAVDREIEQLTVGRSAGADDLTPRKRTDGART